ncbi:MAG TPA: NUDIX domain-containing protein [Symbiobacteriaceae bacterium]|nr:NUDIX domain-containing protein [Symbiobacteriaceae bacterium]
MREKVLAYVTREAGGQLELLVFDHVDFPEAGTQVPGGSIDPGETPDQAVLRETHEESGLTDVPIVKYLGCFPAAPVEVQVLHRHVYHLAATKALPDRWEHVVSSGTDDKGLRFRFHWIPVTEAVAGLIGQQGIYVNLL